jgi:hypothetical protein
MRGVVFLLGGYVAVACLVLVLATLAAAQASPTRGPKLTTAPPPGLAWAPARAPAAGDLPGAPH